MCEREREERHAVYQCTKYTSTKIRSRYLTGSSQVLTCPPLDKIASLFWSGGTELITRRIKTPPPAHRRIPNDRRKPD